MKPEKRWHVSSAQWAEQKRLVDKFNISPLVAQLLINRGLTDYEDVKEFLYPSVDKLVSHKILTGIEKSVSRILEASENQENVLIFGDYDVDGITGTALLVSVLERMGLVVDYYIPDRMEEGYGLNVNAIEWAGDKGFSLIITVDCGISAVDELELAKGIGIDVIITDHHEPPDILPDALAVINPKLDSEMRCRDLAGVGVAFKLAQALEEQCSKLGKGSLKVWETIDLVTLGTIADMVPLLWDNRIIVKKGLEYLPYSARPGMQELINVSGLSGKQIGCGNVGFTLAPRINAVGRLGNASLAVELLLTPSMDRAKELAQILDNENRERQTVEKHIFEDVVAQVESQIDLEREKVIVLSSPLWHSGVIGIVASKIVEKYHRPTILIALEGEVGKSSARSIPGFHLFKALQHCGHQLEQYGGHKQAAGFTIKAHNINSFRQSINELADSWLSKEQMAPLINLDCEMLFHQLDEQLVDQLELLKPHGFGNPSPLFCARNVNLIDWKQVGRDKKHAKITLSSGSISRDGIAFNLNAEPYGKTNKAIDLAFVPEKNYWQGKVNLQLNVRDIRFAQSVALDKVGYHFTPTMEKERHQVYNLIEKYKNGSLAVNQASYQQWYAIETAAALSEICPVIVVSPLASYSKQLYNTSGLFIDNLEAKFISAETHHAEQIVNELAAKQVLFMSFTAFLHFQDILSERAALVLVNISNKGEVKETKFSRCFWVDYEEKLKEVIHRAPFVQKIKWSKSSSLDAAKPLSAIFTERPGVVFTSLPSDAEALAKDIQLIIKEPVMPYSESLSLGQKLHLLNGFNQGLVKVIVTTHGFPLFVDFPINVVITDVPFNQQDYSSMLPLHGNVYSSFNESVWAKQKKILLKLFLNRQTVLLVYNAIKKQQSANGYVNIAKIIIGLRTYGITNPRLAESALMVLEELQLIEKQSAGIKTIPVAEKKELNNSWRFVEGTAEFDALAMLNELFEEDVSTANKVINNG